MTIRLLSLKYSERSSDGLAPVLFGRPDAFGTEYDLIARIQLQPPGDLAEAVKAFAAYLSQNPSIVFYGKRPKILQKDYERIAGR